MAQSAFRARLVANAAGRVIILAGIAAMTVSAAHARTYSCEEIQAYAGAAANLAIATGHAPTKGWTRQMIVEDDYRAWREGSRSIFNWAPCYNAPFNFQGERG